ncbi:TRAP transporter large permease [Halobacterium bonnevillei]|uniref:TRAP transporter large permease subunit n=1 Tax=Halobacterium bonnevillei TaxID=2692200 RepID=A0A6B0SGR4_9EURY|nr:TRAP transporter large permease [Halobacterium bonnevillei]MXR20187.1 TRAP transporter large permease subunit [Halobacterium bonnevillei]
MGALGLIVIAMFVVLALLRVPVWIALLAPALLYSFAEGQPVIFSATNMMRELDSFTFLAIPLFIYVGSLMNHGDITENIFNFADSLVGHYQGGLAQVNIVTSLIFAGISGSALADIGGVGRVLIKSMVDADYDADFSAALTSASATVGPIFPPSIPLIIFGIIAEVSVLSLLLAGALPALLTVAALMVGTVYIAKARDLPSNDKRASLGNVARTFVYALPALLTPVVLVAGMLAGVFSPTEAAGVTVAYILLVNTLVYRIVDFRYVWDAAVETAKTSGSIVIIVAAASVFSFVLSVEGVDTMFADAMFSISSNKIVLLLLVNAVLLFIGLFLDPIAALVMMTPIVEPTLAQAGVDPIHIGVIMVFNLMLGLLTPPLGLSVYLSAEISGVPVADVFSRTKLYYVILIVALLIITYVPQITLFIPRTF